MTVAVVMAVVATATTTRLSQNLSPKLRATNTSSTVFAGEIVMNMLKRSYFKAKVHLIAKACARTAQRQFQ